MRTYHFPGSYIPNNAIIHECTLPFDGNCTMDITLKAKPRTERVFIQTQYSGEKVPDHIASLNQLVGTKTKHPECYTDFKTTGDSVRKIECIKGLRSVSGWGLKEAKEFYEEVARFGGTITICDFVQH